MEIFIRDLDQSTFDCRKALMIDRIAPRPRSPGEHTHRKPPVVGSVKKTIEEEVFPWRDDGIRFDVVLTPSDISVSPAKIVGTKMVTAEKSFSNVDLKLKVRLVMHRQFDLPIPCVRGGGEKEEKKEEDTSHGTNPPEELVVVGGEEGALGVV